MPSAVQSSSPRLLTFESGRVHCDAARYRSQGGVPIFLRSCPFKTYIVVLGLFVCAISPGQTQEIPGRISLEQALQIARRNSPVLDEARSDIRAASADVSAARSKGLPRLSANGFAASSDYGQIFDSSPSVEPMDYLAFGAGSLLDANLMLTAPLYTGGLIESQVRSARARETAVAADAQEVREAVSLQVAESFWSALRARDQISAAASIIDLAQEMTRVARTQFEAGKGIEASVKRSEAELAGANVARAAAEGDEQNALLDLKAAMGVPLNSLIELELGSGPQPPMDSPENLVAFALRHRTLLVSAVARLQSSEADLRAAEGSGAPQLYAVASVDTATRSTMSGTAIGLTLRVPLADGGERRANVARARAIRDRAKFELAMARLSVERDVRKAFVDLRTAETNAVSAKAELDSAQIAYDIAVLRVSNGKGILVEQLDALGALSRAKADALKTRYDREIASARLKRAAGQSLTGGSI